MPATFTVDAYPSQRFRGKVRQIRNAPQTIQNVVTYDAVIDVDNGELKLKPGMTANVTFTYEDKNDVIRVPNVALRFRPPSELLPSASGSASGGPMAPGPAAGNADARAGNRRRGGDSERPTDSRTVWTLQGTTPKAHALRVGVSDGTLTEMLEGDLKPGDQVLTGVASDAAKPAGGGAQQQPLRRMF
jgi:HlyD family secretion protein